MRQSNREDIDFEVEKTEDDVFVMKQGDQVYIQEDEHAEQPDLTLENVGCIPRSPNNISSLLGTGTPSGTTLSSKILWAP